MSRDLFEDYVHAPVFIDTKKWLTAPISIVGHAVVVAVVIVASMVVADVLPSMPVMLAFVAPPSTPALPPVPPSSPRPATPPNPVSAIRADSAPVFAPPRVEPESGIVREPEPAALSGVEGGVPGGVVGGTVAGLSEAPPQAPAPSAPMRLWSGIKRPAKIKDALPVYPALAEAARVSGLVIIEATIGPDGRVTDARILRSIPLLDRAALDAVAQWVYTPTLFNGVPVAVIMTVTVTFTLR